MKSTEIQYKRDTGNSAKVGFDCNIYDNNFGYRVYNVDSCIDEHFDVSDGILELPTAEYLAWLEEKVEELQKQKA